MLSGVFVFVTLHIGNAITPSAHPLPLDRLDPGLLCRIAHVTEPTRSPLDVSLPAARPVAARTASSGLTTRKRFNRGGDRTANQALWRIVMVRMVSDPRTRTYVERRTREGRSKREIIRSL